MIAVYMYFESVILTGNIECLTWELLVEGII